MDCIGSCQSVLLRLILRINMNYFNILILIILVSLFAVVTGKVEVRLYVGLWCWFVLTKINACNVCIKGPPFQLTFSP